MRPQGIITCKRLKLNFYGLKFYMGRISDFLIDFCMNIKLTPVQRQYAAYAISWAYCTITAAIMYGSHMLSPGAITAFKQGQINHCAGCTMWGGPASKHRFVISSWVFSHLHTRKRSESSIGQREVRNALPDNVSRIMYCRTRMWTCDVTSSDCQFASVQFTGEINVQRIRWHRPVVCCACCCAVGILSTKRWGRTPGWRSVCPGRVSTMRPLSLSSSCRPKCEEPRYRIRAE